MSKIKSLYAPLLSSCLVLSACQAPMLQPKPSTGAVKVLQAPSLAAGEVQIQHAGPYSQVRFMPRFSGTNFKTQALRQNDIKKYRMTVIWPGNPTGRSTGDVNAQPDGTLSEPLTLSNIPVGDFRVILVEVFDANGNEIIDLRAGHVYHTGSTATYNATATRKERIAAEIIRHFMQSSTAPDPAVFSAWRAQPEQSLNDLLSLIDQALSGNVDPLALSSSSLISAIQAKGDGSLPELAEISHRIAAPLTLYYKVPVGFSLPADSLRLSLNTASSPVSLVLPAQQAGTHFIDLQDVYLPASGEQSLILRVLNDPGQTVAEETLILTPTGIKTNTAGSATAPLELDDTALVAVPDGLTFYVDAARPDNDGNGESAGAAWQTLSHALTEIKGKTFAADQVPVLVMAPGTYTGEVTVDFPIKIIGAGKGSDPLSNTLIQGSGTGRGLTLSGTHTQRIHLEALRVTGFQTGFELSTGGHYSLIQVAGSGNSSVGLRMGTTASVEDLVIHGSEFNHNSATDNNGQGMFIAASTTAASHFKNVEIKNTQFNDNKIKGIYIEKLSDAVFDGIEVKRSGIAEAYGFNAGIDINLKGYSTEGTAFTNITLKNSVISESGALGTASDRAFPAAVTIKARDDASSYNTKPASLNKVQISNTQISGPINALRFGEAGKNNAGPTQVLINNSQLALEGEDPLARFALINMTQASIDATTNNSFNGLPVSVANAFAIESTLFDQRDNAIHGRIDTGLPANQIYLPFQEDASHIQPMINAAQAGDTIHLQAGTYKPAPGLMINVNKAITLRGEGDATRFERTAEVGTQYLFRLITNDATLSHMHLDKVDKVGQHNLIYLQGNNLTVENMTLTGLYQDGDDYSFVNRAMEAAAGTGMTIRNNTISGLSQAAYINGSNGHTTQMGQISNNRVFNTNEAWVLDGALFAFENNTWRDSGTGPSENSLCDIALLPSSYISSRNAYNTFYGALNSLEDSQGDLLPTGPGMTDCDKRVFP